MCLSRESLNYSMRRMTCCVNKFVLWPIIKQMEKCQRTVALNLQRDLKIFTNFIGPNMVSLGKRKKKFFLQDISCYLVDNASKLQILVFIGLRKKVYFLLCIS